MNRLMVATYNTDINIDAILPNFEKKLQWHFL